MILFSPIFAGAGVLKGRKFFMKKTDTSEKGLETLSVLGWFNLKPSRELPIGQPDF